MIFFTIFTGGGIKIKKQTIIIISLVLLLLTILILIYYYRSSERPLSKIIKISADDAIFWHSEEKDLADFHTLTIEDVKKLNELNRFKSKSEHFW